jgi:hypothetical protein
MLPATALIVALAQSPTYDNPMAKAHKFDLENPAPILDEEDEETLAAIDEGILYAEAGRGASPEKAREVLAKWTTHSAPRKKAMKRSRRVPDPSAFFAKR